MIHDVAIIGSGVCGVNIARKLSSFKVKVAVLEKAIDVSFGTSKANSGIIHGAFHHNKKYLKTHLEMQGNLMFTQLQKELHFPFRRCGIIVAALNDEEMKTVELLYKQGLENKAAGIELCDKKRALELEPKLSHNVVGALYAPGGGIIEPYRFVFALKESAIKNGVEFFTNFKVSKACYRDSTWEIYSDNGESIKASYVVNSAGLFADEVSAIFGAEEYKITPRKGEYYLLDKLSISHPDKVIFPVPSKVSKGMLVIPTVEGTVLVGPTAEDIEDKNDFSTTKDKLDLILDMGKKIVPSLNENDVIASFAGLRPCLEEDFYIKASKIVPSFIHVAGIQSPGLTASPAIGVYVTELLKSQGLKLEENPAWDPYIEDRKRARELNSEEHDELIKDDPAWGNMVCRCENVSEAEIVQSIKQGHSTLDGIKYFTRAQMGRCQGGFCTYKIIKIIIRETGLNWNEISKHGNNSNVLTGEL